VEGNFMGDSDNNDLLYKCILCPFLNTKSWVEGLVVRGYLSHSSGPDSIPVEFVWVTKRITWLGATKWALQARKL